MKELLATFLFCAPVNGQDSDSTYGWRHVAVGGTSEKEVPTRDDAAFAKWSDANHVQEVSDLKMERLEASIEQPIEAIFL